MSGAGITNQAGIFAGDSGAGLYTPGGAFDPASLSHILRYDMADGSMLATGDVAAGVGDGIATLADLGGSVDAVQTTGTLQPIATADGADFDATDDRMAISMPASAAGTMVLGTSWGTVVAEFDYSSETVNMGSRGFLNNGGHYNTPGEIYALSYLDSSVTQDDIDNVVSWVINKRGAGPTALVGITSLFEFARNCTSLTTLDVSNWDTSSVTSMMYFVQNCTSLTTLDVSNWDTSSVTSMRYFARNCKSLTTLDVSNWDTSSVTDMINFVNGCTSLTTLDVSNWDMSSVTSMPNFAQNCTSLTTLDVSNWDTSSVTTLYSFVNGCTSLTTLDASNWDTSSVTTLYSFARNCTSLTTFDVSNLDTSSVTSMMYFARNCTSLTTLDVSNWDTSSVTDMRGFVNGCTSLTTLDVSNWDTSSVTNMRGFVNGCTSLTTLDVSNWDTSSVTTLYRFAENCTSLTTITITGGTGTPFRDSPCTNYFRAFQNCALNETTVNDILIEIDAAGTVDGGLDIDGGTSAAPTGEGITAKNALIARGWTVNTN